MQIEFNTNLHEIFTFFEPLAYVYIPNEYKFFSDMLSFYIPANYLLNLFKNMQKKNIIICIICVCNILPGKYRYFEMI